MSVGTSTAVAFSDAVLDIDPASAVRGIEESIRDHVLRQLRRRGAVVGLSGGVDSSVVAALTARALGADRVLGLIIPERESSPESAELAADVAKTFSIATTTEDITDVLAASGCYRRRDDALRAVMPAYGDGCRFKIVLPDVITRAAYAIYSVVVRAPSGAEQRVRLPLDAYLEIVAATNFKQRVRTMMEYHHADRLRYAVAGTANKLERDLGFFVKQGDGAADFTPIAHLYKSQVYRLAEYLGVPEAVRLRQPTTDTYPLDQSQQEFYFGVSLRQTDLLLYAWEHRLPEHAVADALGLTAEDTARAYRFVESRRNAARYLLMPPLMSGEEPTA